MVGKLPRPAGFPTAQACQAMEGFSQWLALEECDQQARQGKGFVPLDA